MRRVETACSSERSVCMYSLKCCPMNRTTGISSSGSEGLGIEGGDEVQQAFNGAQQVNSSPASDNTPRDVKSITTTLSPATPQYSGLDTSMVTPAWTSTNPWMATTQHASRRGRDKSLFVTPPLHVHHSGSAFDENRFGVVEMVLDIVVRMGLSSPGLTAA